MLPGSCDINKHWIWRSQFQLLDIILVFTFKLPELLSSSLFTVSNLIISEVHWPFTASTPPGDQEHSGIQNKNLCHCDLFFFKYPFRLCCYFF